VNTNLGRRCQLVAIKAVHTVAFGIIGTALMAVFVDGVRGRPTRRTGVATAIVLAECAVFAANGFVCPLTPLAERYGARRGSVTDIFLPDWFARNLTWISSIVLAAGLGLNARALTRRSSSRTPVTIAG
jgi:hypothetical protein